VKDLKPWQTAALSSVLTVLVLFMGYFAITVWPFGERDADQAYSFEVAGQNIPTEWTDAYLKELVGDIEECEQDPACLARLPIARNTIAQRMIQAAWIYAYAKELGIDEGAISEADIAGSPLSPVEQKLPRETQRYLKKSDRLNAKVQEEDPLKIKEVRVSDGEVAEYYSENKSSYQIPETRTFSSIVSTSKSKAESYARQLRAAEDPSSKIQSLQAEANRDLRFAGVDSVFSRASRDNLPSSIAKEAFSLRTGEIGGPVQAKVKLQGKDKALPSAYYVLYMNETFAGRSLSLKGASSEIRQLLKSEKISTRTGEAQEELREKLRGQTRCSPSFQSSLCRGGSDPSLSPIN
jgi:hypothetical protein